MATRRGHCPKCGSRFLFGGVNLKPPDLRADVAKMWKAGPKLSCRSCGASLLYVEPRRAAVIYGALVATSFAVFVVAVTMWGSAGIVIAAVVILFARPLCRMSAEYKVADPGYDR